MDGSITSRRPTFGSDSHWLEPQRVVRVVAFTSILGGFFTLLTLVTPHPDTTYDRQLLYIAITLIAMGSGLYAWTRVRAVGIRSVHASTALMALIVLVLTGYGMRDVGGVQAIYLVLVLGISASIGPNWWSTTFCVLLSIAYAIVLAVSNPQIKGFDPLSQWLVVTIALAVCIAYYRMIRRELSLTERLEHERRAERDRERELHAERLERLNAELRQTSELKSSFVAMASHELRTPLTAIEGFASTLQYRWDDLGDDEKRSFVEVIDAQAQRLGRLVSDLLMLSRIESGRIVVRPGSTDVGDVVRSTLEQLGDEDVELDVEPGIRVRADADHLQQIVVNFISNARAYGKPPIRVTVATEPAAETVDIVVADEGVGVDPSFVSELFDRFAQAPSRERLDSSSGTGLGLSIVEGLAEANDGHAWYEPNEPRGARFCVRLPRA